MGRDRIGLDWIGRERIGLWTLPHSKAVPITQRLSHTNQRTLQSHWRAARTAREDGTEDDTDQPR